jgi:hypothetical protein
MALSHPLTDYEVLETMRSMGDGFARALADLWEAADSDNTARLHSAFEDLYRAYAAMNEQRSKV